MIFGIFLNGTYTRSSWESVKIPISVERNTNADYYSVSDNTIIIKQPGIYRVVASFYFVTATNAINTMKVSKNGSSYVNHWCDYNLRTSHTIDVIISCVENDYIHFELGQDANASTTIEIPTHVGQAGLRGWSIMKVG